MCNLHYVRWQRHGAEALAEPVVDRGPGWGSCSVPGCANTGRLRRTWCGAHHSRWLRTGELQPEVPLAPAHGTWARVWAGHEPDPNALIYFWGQVDKTDSCWLWTGHLDRNGYGKVGNRLAHRMAYTMVKGVIPEGLSLDHLCRVHNCVNPDHLEPVTHAENVRRGAAARRSAA